MGWGRCNFLHTAKLKKTPFAGRRARQRNTRACRAQSRSVEYRRGHGSKPFFEGGGDKFGCCCNPCPCCHVSMEMKEGQDVAHSDYLGGWQRQAFGKHIPFTPTPVHPAVPSRPPGSSPSACSTPFPSGAGIMPAELQAGLLVSALHSQVSLAADF